MRALPDHILKALQALAIVTKETSASDACCGSTLKEVWSKRERDMVDVRLRSHFNPIARKFTRF